MDNQCPTFKNIQIKKVVHLFFLWNNSFLRKLAPPIVAFSFCLTLLQVVPSNCQNYMAMA